jgi:TolB-like protein/Flp pilus assembly protein TadD
MSFIRELKRRNVFRVGIAYLVVAWLLLQVSDTLVPALHLPEWFRSGVAFLLILGFPVALLFAWAFELTPEGIKLQKDVVHSESIAPPTGRKFDFAIIATLALALAYFIWESRFAAPSIEDEVIAEERTSESIRVPDPITIAVLPFINISADPEQGYFSDGITEEILNDLAAIPELAVTSRTSAFAFKGKSMSIPKIAQELGVDHILEGSDRKSGDRLRITAQLIEVVSDKHLWSETYDRDLTDIFAIQDEISESIALALKVNLLGAATAPSTSRPVIPEAYDHYLRGLEQKAFDTIESVDIAADHFERSLEIDPLFVRAQAGLGWVLATKVTNGFVAPEEYLPRIRHIISRGLELDPDNAGLIGLKGQLEYMGGDLDQAALFFRQALNLEPPYYDVRQWYTIILHTQGRIAEAQQVARDALASDPLNVTANLHLATLNLESGKFVEIFDATTRLKSFAPDNPYPHFLDGYTKILYLGELGNGILDMERGVEIDPNDYETISMLAITCFSIGESELADAWLNKAKQLSPDATIVQAADAYGLALRGELSAAREISLQAISNHRHFDRWWGGFLSLRLAVDELVDRGEAVKAVDMILQADPEWAAFRNQSPNESPQLSANAGFYHSGAVRINSYFPDFARALKAAGDNSGADNILAHIETILDWRREHGFAYWETQAAELHALRGRVDEALDALERAEKNGSIYAYWHHRLVRNRIFDEIRDQPRFQALMLRVEAEMNRQRAEFRDNRSRINESDEI